MSFSPNEAPSTGAVAIRIVVVMFSVEIVKMWGKEGRRPALPKCFSQNSLLVFSEDYCFLARVLNFL